MSIKKCPSCGLPVAGLSVCPMCGRRLDQDESRRPEPNGAEQFFSDGESVRKAVRPTGWDMAFIIICNLSFVAILVNAIVGGPGWCHYPVFGLFTVYFILFSCFSGSFRRFLTRYRNSVLFLNLLAGIFQIVCKAAYPGQEEFNWAFDYFIPINILVACIVELSVMPFQKTLMRNIIFSVFMFLGQSIIQFCLMLFGVTVTPDSYVPKILVISAFGVNLITALNLVFLYFIKYRDMAIEKFRFWE